MRRCVTGLTDTCRKSRAAISKRGHSNLSPVRHRSLLAARGARPGDCLLGRRIRMLSGRLFEKLRRLIRFPKNRRGAIIYARLGRRTLPRNAWTREASHRCGTRGAAPQDELSDFETRDRIADQCDHSKRTAGCGDQRRHRSQRRLQYGARPTQYEDHALQRRYCHDGCARRSY
jgi:hypothetical protein